MQSPENKVAMRQNFVDQSGQKNVRIKRIQIFFKKNNKKTAFL